LATTWPQSIPISQVILASPTAFSNAQRIIRVSEQLSRRAISFEFWDGDKIRDLCLSYFHIQPKSFSVQDLQAVLTIIRDIDEQKTKDSISLPTRYTQREIPAEGEFPNTIIVMADFCSFSKFVYASGGDRDLISSVMGRFYRETRRVIQESGGIVDKYMGDGILVFWTNPNGWPDFALKFEECMRKLVGVAVNIAESWQEQIDASVSPTGMHIGAAIGKVLFISESLDGSPPLHAIGDSINLAARLQSAAEPNALVISNRLKKAYFDSSEQYEEMPPIHAKNIGDVVAWKKDLRNYSEMDPIPKDKSSS
jgi:class 3 adenylate cyclase